MGSAKTLLIALALNIAPSSALIADTPLGQIRAFIDREEQLWHTISMIQGGRPVATASFTQSAHYADLYLQGHLEPRFVSKGMLSLDVRFPGQFKPGDPAASIEIIYMPNGMGGQFFTSRGTEPAPVIDIVAFDVWGEAGEIVVTFSGQLCAAWMNRPRDPTDCKTLSGHATTKIAIH